MLAIEKDKICHWFNAIKQALLETGHRRLVVLSGPLDWSNTIAQILVNYFNDQSKPNSGFVWQAWGDDFFNKELVSQLNYRHYLGTENELVFYADTTFHPDAFAALSGTLKAGGMMVWFCPPTTQPSAAVDFEHSLFIKRVLNKAKRDSEVYFLYADQPFPEQPLPAKLIIAESSSKEKPEPHWQALKDESQDLFYGCLTQDQQTAVHAIFQVVSGHRNRPLVLTADRGRGKSSALAIATAQLILQANQRQTLLITGPHKNALAVFFKQLQHCCPQGDYQGNVFQWGEHKVCFVTIDELLKQKHQANLLFVDEASAIPVHLLTRLLGVYHRIVFSSTLHGYEGSGRGFSIKFLPQLKNVCPNSNQLHINQPIRWSTNDPLERFIFDCFLLSSPKKLTNLSHCSSKFVLADVDIQEISQQQLQTNEVLLVDIFAVLVTAHYQTSPSDLKLLLTNPQVRIFVSFYQQQVLAVALALVEGHASTTQIKQLSQSERRLTNQFLPQSLYIHNGISSAFNYRYLRIMRIAVHPSYQQLGIGKRLLTQIKHYAQKQQFDILGTSFAATAELMSFWFTENYQVGRLGFTRDKSSGEHSALLLQGLNDQGNNQVKQIVEQFYQGLSFYLSSELSHLSAQLIERIIKQWPKQNLSRLNDEHKQSVQDYLINKRQYIPCLFSLHHWLIDTMVHNDIEVPALLIARILQRKPSQVLCHEFGITGKKQLEKQTQELVMRLA
jgi:tRNA(Met) cytidine acetyltransferase